MNDALRTQLLATYREAEQVLDVADERANHGDVTGAAAAYSRAAGLLLAAMDDVLATTEVAA